MVGQKSVTNRHTTQVQAENSRSGRPKGIDDLKASPSQVEVKTGFSSAGEIPRREGNKTSFLVSAEELDGILQDSGCRPEKRTRVFGPAESSSGHRHGLLGCEGGDFPLKVAQYAQGPEKALGLQAPCPGDSLSQADRVGLFVVDAKGGAGLFGKEKFESVGAEVEDGSAKDGFAHRSIKRIPSGSAKRLPSLDAGGGDKVECWNVGYRPDP